MTKVSIGSVLSQLLSEANLSPVNVATRLGKARQNVYQDLKRTSMKDEQVEAYAQLLGIDKSVIYARQKGEVENDSFGGKVLEDIKRMIEEELREKNEQIRSLQESLKDAQAIIKMALGKPDLGGRKPWGLLRPLHKEKRVA